MRKPLTIWRAFAYINAARIAYIIFRRHSQPLQLHAKSSEAREKRIQMVYFNVIAIEFIRCAHH